MNWSKHFEKDIAYHAATAHEYDAVVVEPRQVMNDLLFEDFSERITGGERMLDLGTGTGHSIIRFGDRFGQVTGVDHSEEMLGSAKTNFAAMGLNHVSLVVKDMFSFLQEDGHKYQFVSAIGCLHHLPPSTIGDLLRDIHSHLSDDGLLLIAEPVHADQSVPPAEISEWNTHSVAHSLRFSSDAEEADEDPLDYEQLCQSLNNAGFEVVLEKRVWELFPHNLPASAEDKAAMKSFYERYQEGGDVLCALFSVSPAAAPVNKKGGWLSGLFGNR